MLQIDEYIKEKNIPKKRDCKTFRIAVLISRLHILCSVSTEVKHYNLIDLIQLLLPNSTNLKSIIQQSALNILYVPIKFLVACDLSLCSCKTSLAVLYFSTSPVTFPTAD